MTQSKHLFVWITLFCIGFMAGFLLRPFIAPSRVPAVVAAGSAIADDGEARGVQYFAANLAEARRVTAGCGAGSLRGAECANAEQAIVEAESRDRFKRFREK
ncbi:hypothetical protein [Sandaracinobacteroides saxicola]|uniref:Uncharacterized protein n=1 Tax=Sandaracinobacteroides saxicola TaxID=2759707 RepID=A0A7G5IE15_9SPHN|nr:hypothetical protein [Sandaracinobacteroides saxicola]QMW21607.1 hypothetical protein H3309_09235 [Sandaracinobacteroides saxicola]